MLMSFNETDEEIIILYKNGNQEAFRNLINRYTLPLYNFVARIINQNDAPDIIQETFIKVWKNIDRFDAEKASFKTLIFTITKNTAMDFLRKKKILLFKDMENNNREKEGSFEENILDEDTLPDEALEKLQDREFLNAALKKLSTNENEILVLYYQEEMTFNQISKILNKSLNTVKSQRHRALIKLRKILN